MCIKLNHVLVYLALIIHGEFDEKHSFHSRMALLIKTNAEKNKSKPLELSKDHDQQTELMAKHIKAQKKGENNMVI